MPDKPLSQSERPTPMSDSYWLAVQDQRVAELEDALRDLCNCVQDVEFGFRDSMPPGEYVRARRLLDA